MIVRKALPKMASGTMVDHHSQLVALSDISFGDWVSIDTELRSRLSPIHSDLAGGLIEITEAGDLFSSTVSSLLSMCHPSPRSTKAPSGPHRPRATEKLLATLTEKNTARRSFRADPGMFLSVVRVHNKCVKASRKSSFHSPCKKSQQDLA